MGIIEDYAGGTYDPETVRVMADAYEYVLKELHDRGQPAVVRDVIAKRITEIAAIGERDPMLLGKIVLSEFGIKA
jgi:hypothetical protein